MVDMNTDRINRWKCLICGSRQKKVIDLIGNTNKKIGYSMLCCNCGHVDQFALTMNGITSMICGDESKVSNVNIYCGLNEDDLKYCPNLECPQRPDGKIKCNCNKSASIAPTNNNPVSELKIDVKYK